MPPRIRFSYSIINISDNAIFDGGISKQTVCPAPWLHLRTTQIFILTQKYHFICSKVLYNYDQKFLPHYRKMETEKQPTKNSQTIQHWYIQKKRKYRVIHSLRHYDIVVITISPQHKVRSGELRPERRRVIKNLCYITFFQDLKILWILNKIFPHFLE